VGHLALGYLSGRETSRLLHAKVNIPLLFLASIIPDLDLLMRGLIPGLKHRGPTHSLVALCLLSIPALALYGKRAAPHLVAAALHPLGDYMTGGGVQLLWPLNANQYGTGIKMAGPAGVSAEWLLFLTSLTAMLKTRDTHALLQPHPSNLLLAIPILTVLLPPFFRFPLAVPKELILPHLILLALLTLSILRDLEPSLKNAK